ncbi:gamma-glutamylcyclotransferase, partial [Elysia marginata]
MKTNVLCKQDKLLHLSELSSDFRDGEIDGAEEIPGKIKENKSNSFSHLKLTMAKPAGKDIFKYFAYGSNLLRERILINNPSAKFYGIGKLKGYSFAFDSPEGVNTDRWLGAIATIQKVNQPVSVYGVIWDIHVKDLDNLDRQEGCYDAIQVHVEIVSTNQTEMSENTPVEVVQCRTYQLSKGNGITLPSPYYKKVILMGAQQNGLPKEYMTSIEHLPDNK